MSRDFQLDDNLDVIVDKDIVTIADNDELAQRIATSLRTRLNEFEPEDYPFGLTRANALGKGYNEDYLRTDIIDVIATQVDEDVNVRKVEFERDMAERYLYVQIDFIAPDGTGKTVRLDIGGE